MKQRESNRKTPSITPPAISKSAADTQVRVPDLQECYKVSSCPRIRSFCKGCAALFSFGILQLQRQQLLSQWQRLELWILVQQDCTLL